ncbi:competence type IV pilus major pilin ComGC [Virgibacillus halophilus]|uniref:ComG operon protein 3 n=1 Tax=Tigheibacillus halophilus TaxID=361280 RepID=A0ABU5CBG1_9BACI|nr:competence type IV pilus major pilin ComGC [Virgibacillus halophilus]
MFKNEKGFTLIEMLIVLLIISVLIILIVPNLARKTKDVNTKGCNALVTVVQAQVDAYHLDHGNVPASLDVLQQEGYINKDQLSCQGKGALVYGSGKVSAPAE